MNLRYMFPLIAVLVLMLIAYAGAMAMGLTTLFGIYIPYLAVIIFILGFLTKVLGWARSPVPFRIPTTCGQQKSLPWIKQNKIDNPDTTIGVLIRMFFEVVCFRSLFRNTKNELSNGTRFAYTWEIWLWLFALAFHYSFLVVLLRHLRFFLEPVPVCINFLEFFDGFFRMEFVDGIINFGLPGVYLSGFVLLLSVVFLLLRRMLIPQVRYISLAADYFPLFLIIALGTLGLVFFLSARIDKIQASTASALFIVYSLLNGLFFSTVFLTYTGSSIAGTFFITAGMFGGMAVYGLITKRDLSGFGSFLFMGLIGIIIASVVNIFLQSSSMSWMISMIGVLVFTGLTAYDVQKIKRMGEEGIMSQGQEAITKGSIMGALALYLDFINLFLMLLRFFGGSRN